ncbi:carboxymethylenebutenolidase [Paraburkholderia sp. BL23I1N1]|uniref:dienelactone hydrolase family protein n=1 Tax=Paraburkholderia sp. BL23I1N1 TaxID=1938802 RepID=UPI000E770692|nr:dienelactone hydrolase family protein [Paraburkholderia sp. BL23I1N1]RKE36977.1 carboxymethylenebutenolidase [Paraburkholderia sp. BL23I1N1]
MGSNRAYIEIDLPDGQMKAYVARPQTSTAAVVLVLQEIFGVNADVRAACNELAQQGFIAVAPDLFWRDAPGLDLNSWSEEEWQRGLELYGRYDRDRGVRDVAATVQSTRKLEGGSGRVGVMGFCLGGLMTFLVAARTNSDAACAFYGGGTEAYIGEMQAVRAPLLMHLADEDEFIPKPAQTQIREAASGHSLIEIHTYPGCHHAFARHSGNHYDELSASTANARTYAFFSRHLNH